ncbi:MAG TPA: 50S ribosomal protein L1 [Candidatus Cloacimonetes bacterium]|nr:50S ribosomal protein L1 [Candidatus Cloacimonadota bacterium]HEX37866.1 50S ribosomal protein L1 [Candidatus Cloacimonadota bacterium]
MKRGKKYIQSTEKFDKEKAYEINESITLLKEMANRNFDETVELHVRLGVDPKKANQMVRGTVVLPHGTGKQVKVLVFAEGDKAEEAKNAGADFVGMDDLAEKIMGGWTDFDVAIATPDMMGKVGKLARILGPRRLMPNPKAGTITNEIEKAVKEAKAGKVEYRIDKFANIHVPIGKISFDNDKISENSESVMKAILRDRPASAKGRYVRNITLCSTMSPGIKIDSVNYIKAIQAK